MDLGPVTSASSMDLCIFSACSDWSIADENLITRGTPKSLRLPLLPPGYVPALARECLPVAGLALLPTHNKYYPSKADDIILQFILEDIEILMCYCNRILQNAAIRGGRSEGSCLRRTPKAVAAHRTSAV